MISEKPNKFGRILYEGVRGVGIVGSAVGGGVAGMDIISRARLSADQLVNLIQNWYVPANGKAFFASVGGGLIAGFLAAGVFWGVENRKQLGAFLPNKRMRRA